MTTGNTCVIFIPQAGDKEAKAELVNANLLRGKMVSNGYTQDSLARKMKISKNTLSAKINGKSQFDLEEVLLLCELLSITSNDEKCNIFLS